MGTKEPRILVGPPVSQNVDGGKSKRENGHQEETVMEAKGSLRIKPRSCAKVDLRILSADRGQQKRRENLQRLKEVASAGICNAPYVEVNWGDGNKSTALLDTGAQWSLLTEQELTEGKNYNFFKWVDWREEEFQGKEFQC